MGFGCNIENSRFLEKPLFLGLLDRDLLQIGVGAINLKRVTKSLSIMVLFTTMLIKIE
jgi:hypothetical protein